MRHNFKAVLTEIRDGFLAVIGVFAAVVLAIWTALLITGLLVFWSYYVA